jgi:hypothetical protein
MLRNLEFNGPNVILCQETSHGSYSTPSPLSRGLSKRVEALRVVPWQQHGDDVENGNGLYSQITPAPI